RTRTTCRTCIRILTSTRNSWKKSPDNSAQIGLNRGGPQGPPFGFARQTDNLSYPDLSLFQEILMRLRAPLFSVSPCLRGGLLALFFVFSGWAYAQDSKPLDGQPWDLGVWAGDGFSVPGGTKDTHTFNGGVRLGKVLTGDHLGGFVRGNFEWSADLMPVYYIWQPAPAKNAYGAAFNPVNLKWNFTSSARTVPFLELG